MTLPTITVFERSPDRGRGLSRDMRVRWALEEVRQPYAVRLVSFGEMKESAHLALHPFGQIPTCEQGDLVLFESGAIVLHIGERHAGLLPDDANARARAVAWMFAALNTIEPPTLDLQITQVPCGTPSACPWLRIVFVSGSASFPFALALPLGLTARSSAGDLMMVTMLLRLRASGVLDQYPNLLAYVERGEARPAHKRAFVAQLKVFTDAQPTH